MNPSGWRVSVWSHSNPSTKPYGHRHSPETVGQEPVVAVVERTAGWSAMTSPSPCNRFPAWATVQGCPWEPQDYNCSRRSPLGEHVQAPQFHPKPFSAKNNNIETQPPPTTMTTRRRIQQIFWENQETTLLPLFPSWCSFTFLCLLSEDDK